MRASSERVALRFLAAQVMTLAAFKSMIDRVVNQAESAYDWKDSPRFKVETIPAGKMPGRTSHESFDATFRFSGKEYIFSWTVEKGLTDNLGSKVSGRPYGSTLTPDQAADNLRKFYLTMDKNSVREKFVPQESSDGDGSMPYSTATVGKDHGYVIDVQVHDTRAEAERAAREHGGAYVMKGTQMWNEPLGQIEESDRPATYKFVR